MVILKCKNQLLNGWTRQRIFSNCNRIDLDKFRKSGIRLTKRTFASKVESYFNAIGGDSDEPPPDLSPQQVTSILRRNEVTFSNQASWIKTIECNQLASNYPIEDRLRISKLCLNGVSPDGDTSCNTTAFAVFDGHGGGNCADVVALRLFNYIAVALLPNPKVLNDTNFAIDKMVQDLIIQPNPKAASYVYERPTFELIKKNLKKFATQALLKYANELPSQVTDVSEAIKWAFKRCDADLSAEIQHNLSYGSSNFLLHYYSSLAISGCCVTLLLIHNDTFYIASTGDCKAIMGYEGESTNPVKVVELSAEHNSDNINEIKRLNASHPVTEKNDIIRKNRLLGHLMPLRAFGDFNYKWTVDEIRKAGLTRAFGSHVIAPNYVTPPYLIVEPEVTSFNVNTKSEGSPNGKRFIIIATDGLWEQFDSARSVVKVIAKHKLTGIVEAKGRILTDAKIKTIINAHHNTFENLKNLNEAMFREVDIDTNCATHLIRTSLWTSPVPCDPHVDVVERNRQRHERLVTFLTLPQEVVRNYRDDISLIVLSLDD